MPAPDELKSKIQQLEMLLADTPEDATGFFMLGRVCMEAGEYAKAAEAFQKAIAANPKYSAAYRQCGDAFRKANDPEKAREIYMAGIPVAESNGDLQTLKEMQAFVKKL